jgi:hypothetical protein
MKKSARFTGRLRQRAQRMVALPVACGLVACSSLQPLPESGPPAETAVRQAAGLKAGDTVRIRPKVGEDFEFVFASRADQVLAGTVGGQDRQIALSTVAAIEQRQFSLFRTTLVVLGVVALGQLAAGLSRLLRFE